MAVEEKNLELLVVWGRSGCGGCDSVDLFSSAISREQLEEEDEVRKVGAEWGIDPLGVSDAAS